MSQVHDDVKRLHAKQLPILSAVNQSDRIVEWQLPVELARRCGATDRQISFFDEREQLVNGPSVGQCTTVLLVIRCVLVSAQKPKNYVEEILMMMMMMMMVTWHSGNVIDHVNKVTVC